MAERIKRVDGPGGSRTGFDSWLRHSDAWACRQTILLRNATIVRSNDQRREM